MLRDGYNVQFEGTLVRSTPDSTFRRENEVQRDPRWSWIVLFAAFLSLFITNGMHASFGVLYAALISHFDSGREETAWIGSISLGMLCFFGPVASVLIEQIGSRATSIIGAFLCSLGFLISSFATGVALLYFSHGLLFGLGASLTYSSAMTVVTRSFERKRNIATGLCTSGSQFGGISLAPLSQVLFDQLGYANTFRTFSGLLLVVAISSLVYKSEGGNTSQATSTKKSPKDMLKVWKSKAYIAWALGTTMVALGYNIPRYSLAKYAIDQGISKDASAWLLSYLCASSAIGRIIFGRLCEWIPIKLYVCQVCIVACAISALLYPFLKSYIALVITCIIFGLPDGGFIASLSVVTTEIVGPEKMVEGFGFMLFCQSYSNVIGPPLSGMLYDTYQSYKAAFCFAAVPEIIGALILFLIPYYRRNQVFYSCEIEDNSNSAILVNGNDATSTLNPISDAPILPSEEPQGEYKVVINLTAENPDTRLVNVVIQKGTGAESAGPPNNGCEAPATAQDAGIVNKAIDETERPNCTGDTSGQGEIVGSLDGPGLDTSVQEIQADPTALSVVEETGSNSSTETVVQEGAIYSNGEPATGSAPQDLTVVPAALTPPPCSSILKENENHALNAEPPSQTCPEQQLLAITSNELQADPGQQQEVALPASIVDLGLQIRTSNKSISLETSASIGQIASNTPAHPDGHEKPVEEIIHLEPDVPKISPPPQVAKHHGKPDVIAGCHDNVVVDTPEAILAELDTLVHESEVNDQEPSLMTGFTTETGIKPEPLMLSKTLIPEMTGSCLSTAFSSDVSRTNDGLTLPEPLKPTSLSSVREHEPHSSNDVPQASSPLSCELSTVIADVIQSLTSHQSQKSNKESVISNMNENAQENCEVQKHQAVLETAGVAMAEPKFTIDKEPSSRDSSEFSSYYKLRTSVLHSMQSIVAEGCPEDISLLEDISIDLTLDKDPSFASIVLIEDENKQSDALDLQCFSHEEIEAPGVSDQEQLIPELHKDPSVMNFTTLSNSLSHESNTAPAIATSCVVSSKSSHELSIVLPNGIANQEQHFSTSTFIQSNVITPYPGPVDGVPGASDETELVLNDTIVLDLFPQKSSSLEAIPKPIESTNPFYQDLNQ